MTIDTNEPVTDEVQPSAPDRRSVTLTLPPSRVVVRALAVMLVLALIATVVVESIHIHHLDTAKTSSLPPLQASTSAGLDATSRSAVAAATAYAQEFATYNYLHLTQDFAVTEAHSVDPFLTEYQKETAALRPSLIKAKASSTGTVKSAAVVSVTPTTAVIDVFLDQSVLNSASTKAQVQFHGATMTMTRAGGEWKIVKLEVF